MSLCARIVFSCIAAGIAGDGVSDWIAGLASSSPAARIEAAARLRTGLRPSDLTTVFAAMNGATPRQRAALVEIVLDRRDVAIEYFTNAPIDDPWLTEMAGAAWVQYHKNATEALLDARETVDLIAKNLGDSRFVECRADSMPVDELADEVRRAKLVNFDLVVEPQLAPTDIPLARAVMSLEAVAFDSFLVKNLSLNACGTARSGDRSLPALLVVGGHSGERPAEMANRWYRTARVMKGLEAQRAATALLVTGADPLDASLVRMMSKTDSVADTMTRAFGHAPARAAALLAAEPESLNVYLTKIAGGASLQKAARVLAALPPADASGRNIHDLIAAKISGAMAPATRAEWIRALADRKAPLAQFYLKQIAAGGDAVAAACLRGLRRIPGDAGVSAAWDILQKNAGPESIAEAARILVAHPGACERVTEIFSKLEGGARVTAAGLFFYLQKPEQWEPAIATIRDLKDPQWLQMVIDAALEAVAAGRQDALRAALVPAADSVPVMIVAAFAGLIPAAGADEFATRLIRIAPPELANLAHEAAGRTGSSVFVKSTLLEELSLRPTASRPANRLSPRTPEHQAALGFLLGGHFFHLPRSERNSFLDQLIEGAPLTGVSLDQCATLMMATKRASYVYTSLGRTQWGMAIDRALPFPAEDE